MRTRILPLPTFRRRIARRTRARLLARHMLRLLTLGADPVQGSAAAQVRRIGAPLLSRIGLMLLRAAPDARRGHGTPTRPH